MRAAVYLPDGGIGPGRLAEVELAAEVAGPAELALPEVTVRDERGGELLHRPDLVYEPAAGGGPLAGVEAERQARAFGLANVAYHARRALRFAADLLGAPLPHLVVRVGAHSSASRWGGGHYRLPGDTDPPEPYPVAETGEVHLGGGRAFVPGTGTPYFHAPAHNAAIVYHEVGHHICRHTADFRANRLRPPDDQHSGKVALDEGTADFLTALLLGTPDIYGWHRRHIPQWDPRRRQLDARWTMAYLRPKSGGHAHANGTIWASALWTARGRVLAHGGDGERFDRMLMRALSGLGSCDGPVEREQDRRNRFGELLGELLAADAELAPVVRAAMADHGIHTEGSNAQLRARMRGTSTPAVTT
ncbi:hypothetical protein ACFOSC_22215 [Streptantibioticus rubrisoli]|uniref:Uncharacterized protein n=1 Tax=Streptantibioticus rubrisoli TaxID=1387313 RepID=A0ABT1P5N5_9ACTN|nr:hypothetical protein [Streptantibioticus rubrisoli]MCQ4040675.1 hypothetical protein [Streptantibioticus rubrisoli]